MKFIQNDFTKELSELFVKHNKAIESDKGGIYIIDVSNGDQFMLSESETASEDYRPKLIILRS